MSVKGVTEELYVGKKESNIITFLGKKKTVVYENLKSIEYAFPKGSESGYLKFIGKNDCVTKFEFNPKVKNKISKTIQLIEDNNPSLEIKQCNFEGLKLYERWGFIVLMMFCCCAPLGLFLMWHKKKSTLPFRVFLTAFIIVMWGLGGCTWHLLRSQGADETGVVVEKYQGAGRSTINDVEIEYAKYSVGDMMEDLDSNALNASEKYKDQYVEITGKLSNIDSDGKYISLDPDDDGFYLTGVQCYIKDDDQKSKVANMKIDQIITLKGKVTLVGEVLGYSLDIDEIE